MSKHHHKNKNGNKKKETFLFKAPAAESVQLVGSFSQWQERPIPMEKDVDGLWRATIEMEPGEYPYRYLVDGQWQDDAECPVHLPNPSGTRDAVRQVS